LLGFLFLALRLYLIELFLELRVDILNQYCPFALKLGFHGNFQILQFFQVFLLLLHVALLQLLLLYLIMPLELLFKRLLHIGTELSTVIPHSFLLPQS
jgi:hypothetical protein